MKKTTNKLKNQPIAWEKIFGNDISDKELISIIYKELMQLNNKKTTQFLKIGDVNGHFFQKDT